MSFLNTLVSKLGFNQENPKTAFYPTPTGAPIVKQSPGQQAMANLSKPSPFIQTLTKNLPTPTPLKPIESSSTTVKRPDITFQDIGSIAPAIGRTFITRPIRSVIQSFQDIGGYIGDPQGYKPEPFIAKTPVDKALFGEEPIKSAGLTKLEQIQEKENLIKSGLNPVLISSLGFMASFAPLADILPGGAEDKTIINKVVKGPLEEIISKAIKTTDDAQSFKILAEHVDEGIAREMAPKLTLAKTKKEAETVIRDSAAKQLQNISEQTATRIEQLANKQKGIQIAEDGSKIEVPPVHLSADEMDELKFLSKNKNKPEVIYMASKAADLEDTGKAIGKIENKTLYNGSKGVINEEAKTFNNIIEHPTDQQDLVRSLAKRGNEEAKALVQKYGDTKIQYNEADKVIKDHYSKEGYDAVKYKNEQLPQKGTEYQDLSNGKFYNENKKVAELYANQNRNIKYNEETKALEAAAGAIKERKYVTSAKASESIANDISREISETYSPKSNKELVDKSVQRVDEDFEAAKKFANENSTDEAVATRVAVDKELSARYSNATSKEEKAKLAGELRDSIVKHARLATEEGRTVQANALLNKSTPEGMLRTTSRMIDDYNKTAKVKLPQISEKDVQEVLDKGALIEKMPEGMAKDIAKKELTDKLESLIPSPWWKKIITVWKAGLLTGIKTSGVNIQSNFWHGFAEKAKDIPATGIDLATSLFTGNRTKSFTLNGGVKGSMEGIKKGWDYLKTGIEHGAGESALEFGKVHFDSKPGKVLEAYANGVYRVLGAEDMPFFYGALRRSLAEQALVEIKNSKKVFANSAERSKFIQNAIDNPSEEALKLADMDAKVATFRNDTKLGNAATSVRNAHPIVEFLLPFAKTPSAVATAMFNYTPAGALSTLYRNFIKGSFNQKDFAEGLGRAATGMGALWLGSKLYEKGKIALDYPSDQKTQNEWEATGKTANSILINGKWVPLVSFGPAGSVLGIGGYVQKGKDETGSVSGGVVSGLFGGVKGLTEQTFLTGVKNLIDTINAPEKKGQQFVGGLAASVVPTIVSDFNQAFDQYQRKSNDLLDPLKARIPGLRQTLHPKLDVWGQPIERNRTALATAISPIRLSNRIEGPFNTEVERLKMEGEDVAPTKADAKIKNIKLNDDEYYIYQKLYGKVLEKGLTALIENPDYQKQDPDQQAKLFKDAISDVRKATGEAILPEILRKRYDLSPEIDMTGTTTLINELYKKSPDFAKASPEKQKKVIEKFLNK